MNADVDPTAGRRNAGHEHSSYLEHSAPDSNGVNEHECTTLAVCVFAFLHSIGFLRLIL